MKLKETPGVVNRHMSHVDFLRGGPLFSASRACLKIRREPVFRQKAG
jgi:hypothetical protein